MFPSRLRRFCTEELKLKPIVGFIDALQNKGHTVVNAIGIRAAESQARKNLPEWEWSEQADCWVWRPLIRWTEADVIAIHAKHGLKPNPLYLAGATRVGCWPCVFARKAEIKVIAELSPERIAEIEALEAEVTARAIARLERKRSAGEVSEEEYAVAMANMPRTFFHGRGSRTLVPAPIASVVEWSRTGRGGKQLLLFDDQPSGCVRWGLCEANTEGVQE
jgi:3'-phosphoadenosine 5'-phosphosulfate sulfotransferase (PAPS reductase)/FAD synthetase